MERMQPYQRQHLTSLPPLLSSHLPQTHTADIYSTTTTHQRISQSPTQANSPSQTPELSPEPYNNNKRRRSPSEEVYQLKPVIATIYDDAKPVIPTTTTDTRPTKLPRITSMTSRFAVNPNPPQTDVWNPHMQDGRVVLPPLSSAVDNGLTPSRRTSLQTASPSTYTHNANGGGYNYSNTFESQRPPPGSTVTSPVMNSIRVDEPATNSPNGHGSHPYRRPHMASRSQSAIVGGRVHPGTIVTDMAPRMTYNANDQQQQQLSWNIPPPSAGGATDSARQNGYGTYSDYTTNAMDLTTAGDGTPQSPSFAFTSSGFTPPGQPSAMFAHMAQRPSAYTLQSGGNNCTPPASNASTTSTLIDSHTHTPSPVEEELAQLRTKVRELEFVNDLVQLRVVELENERAKIIDDSKAGGSLVGTSPPMSDEFVGSWDSRTEARIKRFCSLNRAGNALCAWHDSRRERRAFPPRMAPPGTLNCGCTFEEALFEESLSRHRVGSYLPGETVRMDPALRNPLLKLLQWRYGYKDGDFERDPLTGKWVEGEGEVVWQNKASSGSGGRRKQSDSDSQ